MSVVEQTNGKRIKLTETAMWQLKMLTVDYYNDAIFYEVRI